MTAIWRRHQDVAYVGDQERAALLSLQHPDRPAIILENSSAMIWTLINEPIDEVTLVAQVAALYDVSIEEVVGPVRGFLEDLAGRDLAICSDAP